ncbi:MAG: hypothetical protein ACI3XQ_02035 [Eubacteriales bacterium]
MLKYKHLCVDEQGLEAVLLGYVMPLTTSEYRILQAIARATVNGDAGLGTLELLSLFGDKKIKSGNVTVHICAINRKAREIGGRKLIVYDNGVYTLNENM